MAGDFGVWPGSNLCPSLRIPQPMSTPPATPLRGFNADIAAVDGPPPSPRAAIAPVRLAYRSGDVRVPSPHRVVEGVRSPARKKASHRSSPRRRAAAHRPSPRDASVFDVFTPGNHRTPPARPPLIVISDERARKLAAIITSLRKKPLSEKRAILPVTRTRKVVPTKKKRISKATGKRAAQKKSSGKKESILFGPLLTAIRPLAFNKLPAGTPPRHDSRAMTDFTGKFQKQLGFRFGEKKKWKGQLGPRQTRSDVDVGDDYEPDPCVLRSSDFKELSRYVLEDVLACVEGRQLLLCISTDLDSSFSNMLSDASDQQQLAENGGGKSVRLAAEDFTPSE